MHSQKKVVSHNRYVLMEQPRPRSDKVCKNTNFHDISETFLPAFQTAPIHTPRVLSSSRGIHYICGRPLMNTMKKILLYLLLSAALLIPAQSYAQFGFGGANINRDSLNRVTAADYSAMLKELGIKEVRPGRQPNSEDESVHPNYDELTANPYPFYPKALVTESGEAVTDAAAWNRIRRPELVRLFEDEVYGRIPESTPPVTWTVKSEKEMDLNGSTIIIRELTGKVDNSSYPAISVEIQAQISFPKGAVNIPVITEFGFMMGDPTRSFGGGISWQQMVLERGWAAAVITPGSIQADAGYGLTSGIIGLCNKGGFRKPADWGSLRAWGWGASRFLDYLESDPAFDAGKMAIEGVSRYGKAALVAMAFDERIAAGFIASSGKAGAAGWRRDCGESIGNIVSDGEYHWMAGNFIKYGADELCEDDIPVDQHELIALCAPRPCFISTGSHSGDKWQDVVGSFISASKASEVYELLGAKGLGTDLFPGMDNGIMDGQLTYRQHHGGHEAGPNWPFFLDFFEREVVNCFRL